MTESDTGLSCDGACLWVAPTARGLGLGRRLVRELEASAGRRGATRVRLETNRTLTAGYDEVAAFNDEAYALDS